MAKRNGAASTILLLYRAMRCADELFASSIGELELTPRQFIILAAIAEAEEPSKKLLESLTGMDRATLADHVRRLVQRKLVERRRTKLDARAYALRLTDNGKVLLAQARPAADQTQKRLLSALAKTRREAFLDALVRVVADLSKAETA